MIRLPSAVYDDSLAALIALLGEGDRASVRDPIAIDFQSVRFYVPSAMVTLLSTINRWNREGREVSFVNFETC